MTADALNLYIKNIDEYIAKLSPAELRRLKSDIGKVVLKANRQRIRANVEPEGNAMTPRAGHDEEGRKLKDGERLKVGQRFVYLSGKHAGASANLKTSRPPPAPPRNRAPIRRPTIRSMNGATNWKHAACQSSTATTSAF